MIIVEIVERTIPLRIVACCMTEVKDALRFMLKTIWKSLKIAKEPQTQLKTETIAF